MEMAAAMKPDFFVLNLEQKYFKLSKTMRGAAFHSLNDDSLA